jgi:hypothetical protein
LKNEYKTVFNSNEKQTLINTDLNINTRTGSQNRIQSQENNINLTQISSQLINKNENLINEETINN